LNSKKFSHEEGFSHYTSQNCLATYSISKRERDFASRSTELTRADEHILKERMEDLAVEFTYFKR